MSQTFYGEGGAKKIGPPCGGVELKKFTYLEGTAEKNAGLRGCAGKKTLHYKVGHEYFLPRDMHKFNDPQNG